MTSTDGRLNDIMKLQNNFLKLSLFGSSTLRGDKPKLAPIDTT